jgi:hypothetical protein
VDKQAANQKLNSVRAALGRLGATLRALVQGAIARLPKSRKTVLVLGIVGLGMLGLTIATFNRASDPVPPPQATAVEPAPTLPDFAPAPQEIADIQAQVAAASSRYATGLIQSAQADFRASQLVVTLGPDWYDLLRSQQDALATDMLQRANDLSFDQLQLQATDGTVLARSPVVGQTMVIVHRQAWGSQPEADDDTPAT